jgi:glutathione peroxidase
MSSTHADAAAPGTIYAYTMDRIDGQPESLEDYKGKVVLVVNVASKCGFTPQYAGLEKLYESKKGRGFVILGFPANNFMGQEPGTNDQIKQFCTSEYGVTFPMFAKISVKGADQAPLYRMLSGESEEPSWNFTKYLIGKDGKLVRRFGPRTTPADPELVNEIDRLLAS